MSSIMIYMYIWIKLFRNCLTYRIDGHIFSVPKRVRSSRLKTCSGTALQTCLVERYFGPKKMKIHTSRISFFATISLMKLCIFWREVRAPSGCSALFVELENWSRTTPMINYGVNLMTLYMMWYDMIYIFLKWNF